MSERMQKHALAADWRDAYVEPRIRDLVRAMNRPALGVRTIAACEGHLRGVNPPYVYFHCPVEIAALIAKRLLLADEREEGLAYSWRLEGGFNQHFDLCFNLFSHALHAVHLNSLFGFPFVTYWLRRGRIDRDLALLARIIDELLSSLESGQIPDLPDPYKL